MNISATTGYSIGVLGRSSSSNGVGIWGDGTRGTSGTGVAASDQLDGVMGKVIQQQEFGAAH